MTTANKLSAEDILAAARTKVYGKHNYLYAVLFSLRFCPRPGFGTLGVDAGWRLWYDPEIVTEVGLNNAGNDGIAAVLAHETWHVLKDHHGRCQGRDPDKFNKNADREINDDLAEAGWRLPLIRGQAVVMPSDIGCKNGELAEYYYEMDKDQGQGGKKALPGCGGQCGGCAGNPFDFEENESWSETDWAGNPLVVGHGRPNFPSPVSELDQELLRRQTAEAIGQHAKNRGNVPAGLRQWANVELDPPKIDWRRQLAFRIRSVVTSVAGAADFTFRRPSRKQAGFMGLPAACARLPGYFRPVPTIRGVLDGSGSMEGGPALAGRVEVMGLCKAMGIPVEWNLTDTRVAKKRLVRTKADLAELGDTGGGTDMRAGIRACDAPGTDLIVVVTDGLTPWPAIGETRSRLLAVITPGGESPPEYIPCVKIEN